MKSKNMAIKKSMTLMEIIMVVILVGILSTIGVANYRKSMVNARQKEAISMLSLIQHAEQVVQMETGNYTSCNGTVECNNILHVNLPTTSWAYSATVTASGNSTNFTATATKSGSVPAEACDYTVTGPEDTPTATNCP